MITRTTIVVFSRMEQQANFMVLQETLTNTTLGNALNPIDWTDEQLESLSNAVHVKGNQYAYCTSSDSIVIINNYCCLFLLFLFHSVEHLHLH